MLGIVIAACRQVIHI